MSTWITQLGAAGSGVRVAVKDAIDVAGVPTTVGCRALAARAAPAEKDADCLAGVRAAGAVIAGKANLHELCFGTSGINPTFGTPRNPLWPDRVPGGSSSGSAAAVATGEADIGIGTDTGGSVRIPAACCGIVGLKTTHGRIPLGGVWPLAPSLDTVGPLARTVADVVAGMALLEPGFSVAGVAPAHSVARLIPRGVDVDPGWLAAVDDTLSEAGLAGDAVSIDWVDAAKALGTVLLAEAWHADGHLLAVPDGVAEPVRSRLFAAQRVSEDQYAVADNFRRQWRSLLVTVIGEHGGVVATPTLAADPPPLDDPTPAPRNVLTGPINLAGFPAIAIPLPQRRSLQLIGAPNSEALLCATAAIIEAAVA